VIRSDFFQRNLAFSMRPKILSVRADRDLATLLRDATGSIGKGIAASGGFALVELGGRLPRSNARGGLGA